MADQHSVPLAGERFTTSASIEVLNPYDGSTIGSVPRATAADGFSAWHVSRGNLYVETIAAPISFIVVERLIGTYRYARSFRRIAGAQCRDVCALRSWLRRRPDDLALRRDWRSGQQKCERQSQN